jgi:hypothetical protein
MSTDIDLSCLPQDNIGCDCTMSTLGTPDATTVAGKVGDDFQMYGLSGINGVTVALNGNVIEIDGGGGGGDLQAAYNGGNTIVVAGALPVDISTAAASHQPLLTVHDSGSTGLFTIDSTGLLDGDALIRFSNNSGITINNPIAALAPTIQDPITVIAVSGSPTAINTTSTVPSVAAPVAVSASSAFSMPIAANSVTMLEITIVARSSALSASFTSKSYFKIDPSSATPSILITTQTGADAAIAGVGIDGIYSAGTFYVNIIAGISPITDYVVRNYTSTSTLNY